jgi:NAD(P) transhydrogenase subunit alpha|tara:strand:- start:2639 stop:3718 length:1080 start_codon:yes stop_codon:yes gene_type:complete
MNVGSTKEKNPEKRISITPDTTKNFKNLGLNVFLEKGFGESLGFSDKEFKENGAVILNNSADVLSKSDLICKVNFPDDEEFSQIKEKSYLIVSNFNPEKEKKFLKNNINIFALNLLPRITRAQSMDVLSSQANLAGYRAVIETIYEYQKAVPMMMTAAGTVPAAKVLVVGAGVAGLQAIATAKRLGAIVSATDVRITAKEQVESLGGKFLTVEGSENLETKGGYAKEVSEDFKKKQAEMLENAVSKSDIIICTALIPGRPAPRIITEKMIDTMRSGSVIFDLAVSQGGNSAYSEIDKIVDKKGIKIIGISNVMNKLPLTASNLYAKNLFSFVRNLYSKEKKEFVINLEDEIIKKTLLKE